jgi:hypothetical protein
MVKVKVTFEGIYYKYFKYMGNCLNINMRHAPQPATSGLR